MDISQVLINTQNPDANVRKQAEDYLTSAMNAHPGPFMLALTQALASEEYDKIGRQAAGLYLKNILDAKDFTLQQQKIQMWRSLDQDIRNQIKEGTLQVLHSQESIARHTAAQFIAKIGSIDLPTKEWPTLLATLLTNVANGSPGTTLATLETLGFLCEELDENVLDESDTNNILTAIVDGIRTDRTSDIRLAALKALYNSIEFISNNFDKEQDRNHIMQVVCEASQCSTDVKVRVAAFEAIASIAAFYYKYLRSYMDALYGITFKAIKEDQEEVGLQAMEFWSTICDTEIELFDDYEYSLSNSSVSTPEYQYYIKSVLGNLVPLLCSTLLKQEEEVDDDSWNLSMAGGTCLTLVSQAVRDDIVDLTIPFITNNIKSNNWHEKEAAIMAFGSILDGPSTAKLAPFLGDAMILLINIMKDTDPNSSNSHPLVRDTCAWTIGKICDLHSECISAELLTPLMEMIANGLMSENNKIANHLCYCIHNLSQAFEYHNNINLLDPYYNVMFDTLLKTTSRPSVAGDNLTAVAYEALRFLIQIGSSNTLQHLTMRLPILISNLEECITNANNNNNVNVHNQGHEGLLCSVVTTIITRGDINIMTDCDRIMQCFLQILTNYFYITDNNTTKIDGTIRGAAAEDAFLGISSIINACPEGYFVRYLNFFFPLLLKGLNNSEEYSVCTVAVGAVTDLCRAIDKKNMITICDDVIGSLLNILRNPVLNRYVKPPVLSCFGDIAMSIEADFIRYYDSVMEMLMQAATACTNLTISSNNNLDDEEMIEYINLLRESILEAWVGIVQGLAIDSDKCKQLLMSNNNVNKMAEFLGILASDLNTRTEQVTIQCVGLIGDLVSNLGIAVLDIACSDFVTQLITECIQLPSENANKIGKWTSSLIQKLRS